MTAGMRNFVRFTTDLFVHEQREEDIDGWSVGGDCAGWFYSRLLAFGGIRPDTEPVMEDWGWAFAVRVDHARAWIYVWAEFDRDNSWVVGIEVKKTFPYLHGRETVERAHAVAADALDDIVGHDPRFSDAAWFEQNPIGGA